MVNYCKWDAIGDSSDDEAPSRLAQDVETKLAVAPPQAPPRNPKAEVLTDRANQVVNSLIEKHGEDAVYHASQRADELLDRGDIDGRRMWQRIHEAVQELFRDRPQDGESVQ